MTNSREDYTGSFKMEGTVRRALWVYAGPFSIGLVLTYMYAAMALRTGHLLLLWLPLPLYAYVFADLALWLIRGIRRVEIDPSGINLHRTTKHPAIHLDPGQITGVYVSRSLDRTTVNILLRGANVTTFLGFRRYSGPRIRITVEPFDRKEFSEFARRMTSMRRTAEKEPSS